VTWWLISLPLYFSMPIRLKHWIEKAGKDTERIHTRDLTRKTSLRVTIWTKGNSLGRLLTWVIGIPGSDMTREAERKLVIWNSCVDNQMSITHELHWIGLTRDDSHFSPRRKGKLVNLINEMTGFSHPNSF
jgi:hypothetical protein